LRRIVRFALKYPHTFYVMAALILFLGVTAAVEMPTDIFPEIDIPVVSVIWRYSCLNTTQIEQRLTASHEVRVRRAGGCARVSRSAFAAFRSDVSNPSVNRS
jgi:multidrug efflux pump subunit AcrB